MCSCTVGWHSNWRLGNSRDGVPHCCQLWRPPQGWKIVLLPWNFGNSITSMLKTCIPNFKSRGLIKQKILKINHHGVAVRKVSQPPTLTPSQGLRKFFLPMEFLEWEHLYVDYMCGNFQVQKMHKKNHIPNLPTCVIVRKKGKNHFTTSNFDTLPRIEGLLFQHEIFDTW